MLDCIKEDILGQNIKTDIKKTKKVYTIQIEIFIIFMKMTWKYLTIFALIVPCLSRLPPSYEDTFPGDITGTSQNGQKHSII